MFGGTMFGGGGGGRRMGGLGGKSGMAGGAGRRGGIGGGQRPQLPLFNLGQGMGMGGLQNPQVARQIMQLYAQSPGMAALGGGGAGGGTPFPDLQRVMGRVPQAGGGPFPQQRPTTSSGEISTGIPLPPTRPAPGPAGGDIDNLATYPWQSPPTSMSSLVGAGINAPAYPSQSTPNVRMGSENFTDPAGARGVPTWIEPSGGLPDTGRADLPNVEAVSGGRASLPPGVNLAAYPNAMSAPRDVQLAVVRGIPLSRFGGRTQRMLQQKYGRLDTRMTIGQLEAQHGAGFTDALANIESNNRNIFSTVDPDRAGPGTRSQGFFQIDTPTWHEFASRAAVSPRPRIQYGVTSGVSSPSRIQSGMTPGAGRTYSTRYGPPPPSHVPQSLAGGAAPGDPAGTMASTDVEMPAGMGPPSEKFSQKIQDILKRFGSPQRPIAPPKGGGGVPALQALVPVFPTPPVQRFPGRGAYGLRPYTVGAGMDLGTGMELGTRDPRGGRRYDPRVGAGMDIGTPAPGVTPDLIRGMGPTSMNDAMQYIDAALTPEEQDRLLRDLQLQRYA